MSAQNVSTPGYTFGLKGDSTKTGSGTQDPASSPLYPFHKPGVAAELIATANALVNPRGRGIYATDETPEGIAARLSACKPWSGSDAEAKERRRAWRACLYSSMPKDHISGVILYTETLHDFELAPVLEKSGIIPGVRADNDSHPLPGSPAGEPATQGLDDLLPRMQRARAAGARFSKWRAPILCNASTLPTTAALEAQAEALARFAAISQQAGLVPIVEPDVDFAEDASLERSVEVHQRFIGMIYSRCNAYGVLLEGSLIKPSFVQPGLRHNSRANTTADDIALATATVLARTIPVGVAGVVFLSGGLSDDDAAGYLNAINSLKDREMRALHTGETGQYASLARLPRLTFSFGRGLQGNAMTKWAEGDENGAKEAFAKRAEICYKAARGELNAA